VSNALDPGENFGLPPPAINDGWKWRLFEFGICSSKGKLVVVCTLALYFQISPDYPLIVAANRDERYERPTAAPALLHGPPRTLAGRDMRAGGTWLGVSEDGLLAAILNRKSSGAPALSPPRRSRGLLCWDLLGRPSADEARSFLRAHQESYEPFALVVADAAQAWVAANSASSTQIEELPPGLHVFSNTRLHDEWSEKKQRAYTLFAEIGARIALLSEPSSWIGEFTRVLSDHSPATGSADTRDAICVHGADSGTVSSSIIVYSKAACRFESYYCAGAPCRSAFGGPLSLDIR
jgi:uncharacterized protein with NRDE domain